VYSHTSHSTRSGFLAGDGLPKSASEATDRERERLGGIPDKAERFMLVTRLGESAADALAVGPKLAVSPSSMKGLGEAVRRNADVGHHRRDVVSGGMARATGAVRRAGDRTWP
jgi:hypothetical protein